MPHSRIDEYVANEVYLRRPPLRSNELMAVRVRVAIKCVDRLFSHVQWAVSERDFPDWAGRQLGRMSVEGRPHPLADEIRDVLAGWKRGEIYAQVYFRAAQLQAKRVVSKVYHGGRRGR